jgi:hypothetical protein
LAYGRRRKQPQPLAIVVFDLEDADLPTSRDAFKVESGTLYDWAAREISPLLNGRAAHSVVCVGIDGNCDENDCTVAVTKNWLDVVFILGRRLKHRRIKKAQEEYPGIVHFLRVESAKDVDDNLAGWLQEAYDHRIQKDQKEGKE